MPQNVWLVLGVSSCQPMLMSKLCSTMRLQSHPGFSRERIKRARKQMPCVQRTCSRFWPLWMSHAASYPSCRIFILILVLLLSDYTIVYIYIHTIRTYSTVQHIEWDCEARLALVDTSSGFSRCIHIWKKYPCCASIREIVHRIDLITCSNRTRIGLDIQLARNIFMQNGSCSFTWANELVFLFAVPAEWSTI